MWGETAGIESHLRNGMRNFCSGNFINYMKAVLMKSPNGGNGVPTGHLLSPNEASRTRTCLHSIELLAKGVPWISPNNLDRCHDNGSLLAD